MLESASPYENVEPAAVRALLAANRPDAQTVLDVRQDWEYEEFHLPGAVLIPLSELEDRLSEIPKDKPLFVYCHAGRRSAAAASLLVSQGFPSVSNIMGGIMAWKGATAVGTPQSGMDWYKGTETPDDILALAFAMERELGAFYERLAEGTEAPELKDTFAKLAGFEDRHKLVVYHLYKEKHPESDSIEDLAFKAVTNAMEGGRSADEVLETYKGFQQAHDALDLAMGVEAQALDLYMRYAAVTPPSPSADTLRQLANEERAHLKALATMMDKLGERKE